MWINYYYWYIYYRMADSTSGDRAIGTPNYIVTYW